LVTGPCIKNVTHDKSISANSTRNEFTFPFCEKSRDGQRSGDGAQTTGEGARAPVPPPLATGLSMPEAAAM